MKLNYLPAKDRGHFAIDWLDSHHSFSFGHYFDPRRMGFGVLRVLNDDTVEPGKGFDTHPHKDMEIVTIPLSGSLKHRDSTGHESVITVGDVQRMTAGTGIAHSEFNPSAREACSLLQIWVLPERNGLAPGYEEKHIGTGRDGEFQLVVSPNGRDGSLSIHQEAYFSLLSSTSERTVTYRLHGEQRGAFVFVIEGSVEIGERRLGRRDAAEITDAESLTMRVTAQTKLLVIEVKLTAKELAA